MRLSSLSNPNWLFILAVLFRVSTQDIRHLSLKYYFWFVRITQLLLFERTFADCHVPRCVRGPSRRLDPIRHSRGSGVQFSSLTSWTELPNFYNIPLHQR